MTEIEDSELQKLFDITKGDNNIITIGTTVDTGKNFLISLRYVFCMHQRYNLDV